MTEREPIESLARRAAGGDRQAFDELAGIYGPRLAALAGARMGKRALQQMDVADVVQETFAKAFQHIDRLVWKGEKAFFGWLASIAENVVFSAVQKVRRAPLQIEPDTPDRETSPSKNLRRQERLERGSGLDPGERCLQFLTHVEDLELHGRG